MNKQYHYIYKITNKINGRIYIGIHSTSNLNDGYYGSGKLILKAIDKYGKNNFDKVILKFFNTREEAFEEESRIVNENFVGDYNTYNLQLGGSGGINPETKEVFQFTLDGIFVNKYPSVIEASKHCNVNRHTISKCCNNNLKSADKYLWSYTNKAKPYNNVKSDSKTTYQFDLKGSLINVYKSKKVASYYTGISESIISRCCNNHQNNAKGFLWSYSKTPPIYDDSDNRKRVSIHRIDENNNIKEYTSIYTASKEGFDRKSIKLCCDEMQNKHKGYKWKYSNS